jgi:hypothetical protein
MAHRGALALIALGGLFLVACDSGDKYHSNLGDEDYRLEEMALRQGDLPAGFQQGEGFSFSVEEWAEVFGSDDPEATARQLEAQGWLRNWVTESVPARFGKTLNVRSVSTLYTNEQAASESTAKFACGLPVGLNVQLDPFIVPKMGEESNGFFHEERIDEQGTTLVYTTVCFRTGRIVHVVQEASLPGLEDIGSSVRHARTMLNHVDDAFENPSPADDSGEEEDG